MKFTATLYMRRSVFLAVLILPHAVGASTTWQLTVGSQRPDCPYVENTPAAVCQAAQGSAFEPNEIWITAGDSITWTKRTDEVHTVTLLQPGQVRPGAGAGCTAINGMANSPSGSPYDPTSGIPAGECVSSGILPNNGSIFTVSFPTAGNYKFTCLIHAAMYGTVHVLPVTAALPHNQAFYDNQQLKEANEVYNSLQPYLNLALLGPNQVAMSGMVVGSGGGWGYESIYRFLKTVITIHVGDTVEWINFDPVEPHTITFGCPTDDPTCPTSPGNGAHVNSAGPIAVGPDGSWAAEITKPFNQASDQINSGLLLQAREDAGGQPQANPALTNKFSLKFDFPGDYRYICELHDQLGMVGHVIVVPRGED
jgi:plastocyanin